VKNFVPLCAGAAVLATSSMAWAFQQRTPQAPPSVSSTYSMRHPNSNTSNNNFRNQYESRVVMRMEDQPQKLLASAKQVAECVVRKAKDKTGDLIGGPMTKDPEFTKLSDALTGRYELCYQDVGDGLPIIVLNGMVAQEAVRAAGTSLPRYSTPVDAAEAQKFYTSADGQMSIDSLARCLAVYSPGLVYRYLNTAIGSPEERSSLEAVYAETPACNVRTPPTNIPQLEQRSALATGLYAWTHKG